MASLLRDIGVGLPVGAAASVAAVMVVELWQRWRIWRAAAEFKGKWTRWVFDPYDGRLLVRDSDDLGTIVKRKRNPFAGASHVLTVRSHHRSSPEGERRWEGELALDRSLRRRALLSWRYVDEPPDRAEFGVYEVFLRGRDELLVTPFSAPDAVPYRKHVLRRVQQPR